MIIPDINAIHEIVPPAFYGGVNNRQLPPDQMLYFRARGISMPDKEELDRQTSGLMTTKNPEERLKEKLQLDYALARKKFVSVHNYLVPLPDGGSRPVIDFDDFCRVAPPELVAWYMDVIQYGEKLSAAERRNFLPPPDSPSGSQSGENRETGPAATAMPNSESAGTAAT